jgi:hypothetical protein
MSHNFNRQFSKEINGETTFFEVQYDPKTHHFTVTENTLVQYKLVFDPTFRTWTTTDGPEPSIPVEELATLVQQSFGVFV